jgi:hypothetical protein
MADEILMPGSLPHFDRFLLFHEVDRGKGKKILSYSPIYLAFAPVAQPDRATDF